MLDLMSDKEKKEASMFFQCSEATRRAIKIAASKYGLTVGEVIEEAVAGHFPGILADAKEGIERGDPGPKEKRGRKAKGSE